MNDVLIFDFLSFGKVQQLTLINSEVPTANNADAKIVLKKFKPVKYFTTSNISIQRLTAEDMEVLDPIGHRYFHFIDDGRTNFSSPRRCKDKFPIIGSRGRASQDPQVPLVILS